VTRRFNRRTLIGLEDFVIEIASRDANCGIFRVVKDLNESPLVRKGRVAGSFGPNQIARNIMKLEAKERKGDGEEKRQFRLLSFAWAWRLATWREKRQQTCRTPNG
jgi:hypothetical protein